MLIRKDPSKEKVLYSAAQSLIVPSSTALIAGCLCIPDVYTLISVHKFLDVSASLMVIFDFCKQFLGCHQREVLLSRNSR
jgi:hypothetical protein